MNEFVRSRLAPGRTCVFREPEEAFPSELRGRKAN